MPENKQVTGAQTTKLDDQAAAQSPGRGTGAKSYVDHGVESLVAMDNPDDSQLGTKKGKA